MSEKISTVQPMIDAVKAAHANAHPSDMVAELVEELRCRKVYTDSMHDLLNGAADEIERLRASNEAMRKALKMVRHGPRYGAMNPTEQAYIDAALSHATKEKP